MAELGMDEKAKDDVKTKYLAIRYDFLIGFKSVAAGNYNALYSGEMIWPLPGYHTISSPYGMRTHPIIGDYRMHYGIDIPAPEGTPTLSPANGKVISYEYSDAVGWTMVVDHGVNENGERIMTRYCHLSDKVARVGQEVAAGEVIAKVGNTGYLSTGAHLHFEVTVNGVTVDPATMFTSK
jgi:murein DD-endopeptidase MepM/ murein hydrolase activator NlpD